MAQVCKKCSRPNPDDAAFCYFDGAPFAATVVRTGAVDVGAQPFSSPFVFPSTGRECRSFDDLATYCWRNWDEAREVLQKGLLEPFLGRLGRVDLAAAAHQAAQADDKDHGLDQLLAKLPSKSLKAAKLTVDRERFSLGKLKIGDNRDLTIHLKNEGMRLLQGNIACDNCVWLTLGAGAGVGNKHFAFTDELTIPVRVRGDRLHASGKPLEAQIVVESSGGNATITVTADVPPVPFPPGALAGATTPRQVAEKAKTAPREAALLFEKGAIAAWYKDNGWDYPVKIPSASGIAAIQQFFEALGLTAAPKVKIEPTALKFKAKPGAKLEHNLEVSTEERRAVWAHAIADQPWIQVSRVSDGKSAVLRVEIPEVPDQPGEILRGKVTVLSNGRKRFVIPVLLGVVSAVKSKKVTPMPVEIVEAVEILSDAPEPVEIVEVSEVPAKKSAPVEIIDPVEVVEPMEIVDVEETPDEPTDEKQPAPRKTQPKGKGAKEPTPAESSGNPFAFDEEDAGAALKRKKDDSMFGKLFGRSKKDDD
jgi:hypothetical protein